MIRSVLSLFLIALTIFAAPAAQAGEERRVVVELFTSQGCSACPPADELMRELAKRGDVVALALHVDYWDYIGWKDSFANPAFTARQKAYAKAQGNPMVYTPQMIVGGRDQVMGTKEMKVVDLIAAHRAVPARVVLVATREAGMLRISAQAPDTSLEGPLVVHVVRYRPKDVVEVRRGENAGKMLEYSNIVTDWRVAGEWNPAERLAMQMPVEGDAPVVVMVQRGGQGPILAVAELK
ncbi:DUF1223 domain-containing protein [Roseovarius sp.]|jgi:hypothetical protein